MTSRVCGKMSTTSTRRTFEALEGTALPLDRGPPSLPELDAFDLHVSSRWITSLDEAERNEGMDHTGPGDHPDYPDLVDTKIETSGALRALVGIVDDSARPLPDRSGDLPSRGKGCGAGPSVSGAVADVSADDARSGIHDLTGLPSIGQLAEELDRLDRDRRRDDRRRTRIDSSGDRVVSPSKHTLSEADQILCAREWLARAEEPNDLATHLDLAREASTHVTRLIAIFEARGGDAIQCAVAELVDAITSEVRARAPGDHR